MTGASRGIGRAIAIALGADGAVRRRQLHVRTRRRAARDAGSVRTRAGRARCRASTSPTRRGRRGDQADRRRSTGGSTCSSTTRASPSTGSLLRTEEEDWQRTLDVNLAGAFHCCKAAARYLLEGARRPHRQHLVGGRRVGQRAGRSRTPPPRPGLIGLTMTLAKELASRGGDRQLRDARASSRPT